MILFYGSTHSEIKRYNDLAWQEFAISKKRARISSAIQSFSTLLSIGGIAVFLNRHRTSSEHCPEWRQNCRDRTRPYHRRRQARGTTGSWRRILSSLHSRFPV